MIKQMEKKMNYFLFEVINYVSGNRQDLVKVDADKYSRKEASRIVKQNFPKSLFVEFFNGGYELDEPRCEEIFWKVNYKFKRKLVPFTPTMGLKSEQEAEDQWLENNKVAQ
tara:strand:- start:5192 stop:5524 length:333 start_codon:yes stop_codon:yes gene_type:complete